MKDNPGQRTSQAIHGADEHTMDYYSAIKRGRVLIKSTTLMNLENVLSGIRSLQILYDSIIWGTYNRQMYKYKAELKRPEAGDQGGEWGALFNR